MDNNLAMLYLVRRRAAERRRSLRLQRRQLRDASNAFELPEVRFMELFRLPQYWVAFLIETLTPFLRQTARRTGVPVNLRILAALNFYATGSYQRSVGEDYHVGLSQTMISRAINEVSLAIERHLMADWIKFPSNEAEKTAIKQRFMEKTGFPGVIGAIDCTHIAILAPSVDGHNYRNRKGYNSKNVQIIADYDLNILNINARFAGSTHDSFIWRNSVIRQHMLELHEAGIRGSWLLGDSGYPLEPWLMTPITNAVNGPEERYTACHARTRVCVERLNGVLKSVFRCLGADRILRYSPRVAGMIINACAVLHNMRVHMCLVHEGDTVPYQEVPEYVPEEADDNLQNIHNEGRRVRANIVGHFR